LANTGANAGPLLERSLWPRRRQSRRILPLLVYFTAFEGFGGFQSI